MFWDLLHIAEFPKIHPDTSIGINGAPRILGGQSVKGGPQWALFDLGFRHATTQTWAYSRVFGFYRIFFCQK